MSDLKKFIQNGIALNKEGYFIGKNYDYFLKTEGVSFNFLSFSLNLVFFLFLFINTLFSGEGFILYDWWLLISSIGCFFTCGNIFWSKIKLKKLYEFYSKDDVRNSEYYFLHFISYFSFLGYLLFGLGGYYFEINNTFFLFLMFYFFVIFAVIFSSMEKSYSEMPERVKSLPEFFKRRKMFYKERDSFNKSYQKVINNPEELLKLADIYESDDLTVGERSYIAKIFEIIKKGDDNKEKRKNEANEFKKAVSSKFVINENLDIQNT